MKILHIGPMGRWSTTAARVRGLQALGHDVTSIDTLAYVEKGPALLRKIERHLLIGMGMRPLNRAVTEVALAMHPDLIWVDQGLHLWPRTVAALRLSGALLVHYTSDYLSFHGYAFRHYLAAAALYDAHLTTNPLNEPLLEQRGARNVMLWESFAFDPDLHRPLEQSQTSDEPGCDAIFVGHWEPTTERYVAALLENGVDVRVWGPHWESARARSVRSRLGGAIHREPIYGQDYVRALSRAKLCLGIVSTWNHNQSTMRTFEIPAVGGFFLAQRTDQHRSCYQEGEEAEFFADEKELVAKATYYLAHDDERRAIGRAGHQRCITSGYRHQDRLAHALDMLQPLFGTMASSEAGSI